LGHLAGQALAGLATGGVYALMALAIVMVHRATGSINLAQGEMATFSAFLAWQMIDWGWPFYAAAAGAVALSFAGGGAIGLGFHRTLRNAASLVAITATIALFAITNSVAGFLWGHMAKVLTSPFGSGPPLAGGLLSRHSAGMILSSMVIFIAISLFFRLTRTGLALRAAADNPVSATLAGIGPGRSAALGWGLGAAVGAVAGILVAPTLFLEPNMMGIVILFGLTAAVVGGLASPLGAVVAGLGLGVVEALATAFLPVVGRELKLALLVLAIPAFLILRPGGLWGPQAERRV